MENWSRFTELVTSLPPELPTTVYDSPSNHSHRRNLGISLDQAEGTYQTLLKAHPGRKNWKVEEANLLLYVVEKLRLVWGLDGDLGQSHWVQVAELLPHRTPEECKFRYLSMIAGRISDRPWSQEEGALLSRVVQNQTASLNWGIISRQFHEISNVFRTPKQCRQHYNCFLRPELKKGSWTEYEDYQLVSLYLQHGKKWSKIAKVIEGRNENAIKNRFFLMFKNKKDSILTPSDMLKLAKRRLSKLQKRLGLNVEHPPGSQTPTEASDAEIEATPTLPQILIAPTGLSDIDKAGMSQEYEQYIDL